MMSGRSYVMMGSLSNFTMRQVLEVVALSRQHTVIELHRNDGSKVVSINLKGGHLVKGGSDERDPRESLGMALKAPESCTFHVFRLDDADSYQSSGQLVELLSDKDKLQAASPAQPAKAAVPAPPPAHAAPPPPQAPAQAAHPPRPAAAVPPPSPVHMPPPPSPPQMRPAAPPERQAPAAAASFTGQPARTPGPLGVSLAVASPKGGAGKTTIALNLGISLANRGLRVIVIDADVNGDLLSLINQRGSASVGTYDVLKDPAQLDRALRRTVVHGLHVLPASNRQPREALIAIDRTPQWRALIRQAMELADAVLVDCPAGMSHTTLEILQSVSHVLGIFQAETVASRSFEMFERGLSTLSDGERPAVAGVVVNMLRQEPVSDRSYQRLIDGDSSGWVLKTALMRSDAFEEAAAAALPIRMHGTEASRKMAWLFDDLAAEVAQRASIGQAPGEAAPAFML